MKRQWDGHCPECHCDSISLLYLTKKVMRKRCDACKHAWNEMRVEKPVTLALLDAKGWVSNEFLKEHSK